MSLEGRVSMRRIVERILDAYLHQVEGRASRGAVDGPLLRAEMQGFLASPDLGRILAEAHHQLLEASRKELIRQQRGDPFNRLVTHPMTEALCDGRLSRDSLGNYFSFLHLVLGDARDVLAMRCAEVLEELRRPDPLVFSWDHFYDDPRSRQVLWTVLIRVSESFKRFDLRRDWFISLMQNRPQAVSIGPNAFVPRPSHEETHSFGLEEFNTMFVALFGQMRHLSPGETRAFERDFGVAPEKAFGPLLLALEEGGAIF
jgi:hypothetical protein